jgi:adenylylsulfate kinase-like enzyme
LKDFTGVSAPYEAPTAPELEVKSGEKSVEACLADLLAFVERRLALI